MRFTKVRVSRTLRVGALTLAMLGLAGSLSHASEPCDGRYGMGYRVVYGLGFDRYGMSSGAIGTAYPGYFGYGMGIPGFGNGHGGYWGYGVIPGAYGIVHPGEPGFADPGLSGIGGFYTIYGPGR